MNPDDFVTAREFEARNTLMNSRLDKIDIKLDTISQSQNNMRADGWKYVATSMLSFLGGTGMYVIVEIIVNHIPH